MRPARRALRVLAQGYESSHGLGAKGALLANRPHELPEYRGVNVNYRWQKCEGVKAFSETGRKLRRQNINECLQISRGLVPFQCSGSGVIRDIKWLDPECLDQRSTGVDTLRIVACTAPKG